MRKKFPYKVHKHPFGVKEYACESAFTPEEIEGSINHLEQKYFSVGNLEPDVPGYQTPYNDGLLDQKGFEKLRSTFLECARNYMNRPHLIKDFDEEKYDLFGWCYLNWKSSPRNGESRQWHIHNIFNPNSFSAILYLKLPKKTGGETVFRIGGNEFELPSNELRWFLFPSNYIHAPGAPGDDSDEKRYVLSIDFWMYDDTGTGNGFLD